MKTLVIGKGGREHAIAKALRLSPSVTEVHIIPGGPGMVREGLSHLLSTSDQDGIVSFTQQKNIDLVVIGPEVELAAGLADEIRKNGVLVFGPSGQASQLEASKIFAKEFMQRAGVPTAKYEVVQSVEDVSQHIEKMEPPYVLKADGLAAGKGVFICENEADLIQAAELLFVDKVMGQAGAKALLEESLSGPEMSVLCLTNGFDYRVLPIAQDHKRLQEEDNGPNTGGMGVVAPLLVESELWNQIDQEILKPTIKQIEAMGFLFRGVIYVGLMITDEGPKVLEYNVRFGDPEAQVIMPLLEGDWGEVFSAVAKGDLPMIQWNSLNTSCVVLAAEGYPEDPKKNVVIDGDVFEETPSSYFLHAGTEQKETKEWVTNGGRVLNAIGIGSDIEESLKNAYSQAKKVSWPGRQMRKDIGKSLLF